MKRLVSIVLVILVLSAVVFLAWYTAQPDDLQVPPSSTGETVFVDDTFGLGNIKTIPYEVEDAGREIDVTERRDDRIVIPSPRPIVRPSGEGEALSQQEEVAGRIPRLTRLFAGRVAGYRIDQRDDGSWVVKVVEAGTGSRYRISTNPYNLQLISPGEIRKVVEGHLFANDTVLLLYEGDDEVTIKSAFVPFNVRASAERLQRFEDNIRVATDYENRFFYTRRVNDKTVGIVVDVESAEDVQVVWQSGFSHWIPRWGRNSFVTIATPITSQARGNVYILDPTGQNPFKRLVDPVYGGSAFVDAQSGYLVLYETERNAFTGKTVVTNLARDTTIDLPITLPEKCDGFNGLFFCAVPEEIPYRTVSNHETIFPDSWYQGDVSFVDAVFRIDTETGEARPIMLQDEEDIQILSNGELFDIVHPRVSEDGKYLFFMNKNNLSLWMLKLP